MGDKRRGEIICIDFEEGLGTIIDENHQDIQFLLDEVSDPINLNVKVLFEIDLTEKGLVAVKVELEKIVVPV